MSETNLRILTPSRKKQRPGDVFAMQMPDELYLFGRVISNEAIPGIGMSGAILIYVFRSRSEVKVPPDRAELRPANLLVSPMMTNRLPWSRGYFETIERWPLEASETLGIHCFLHPYTGEYFDEKGNELPGPVEPVGDYGLHSYRTIDDEISDALGFPRVPS